MTPPPIFTHALNLFEAFDRAPNTVTATEKDATDLGVAEGARLFIGHWSTQFQNDPDLPGESTQQKAYAFLQDRDCIEILRRGGRDYPGVILLKRAPDHDDAGASGADSRAAKLGKVGTLEVSVRGLLARVSELEDLTQALAEHQDAILRSIELTVGKVRAEVMARIDGLVEPAE